MAAFNKDMVKLAKANSFFQKEVYLDKNVQIVLMSLKPGEDIGEEGVVTKAVKAVKQTLTDLASAKPKPAANPKKT